MHGVEINTRAYVATRLLLRWDYLYAVTLKTKVFGDYNHARLEVSWITSTRGLLLRGYTGRAGGRLFGGAPRDHGGSAENARSRVLAGPRDGGRHFVSKCSHCACSISHERGPNARSYVKSPPPPLIWVFGHFWLFCTMDKVDRHLLWEWHKKIPRKVGQMRHRSCSLVWLLHKVVHKIGRFRKFNMFNRAREIEFTCNFFTAWTISMKLGALVHHVPGYQNLPQSVLFLPRDLVMVFQSKKKKRLVQLCRALVLAAVWPNAYWSAKRISDAIHGTFSEPLRRGYRLASRDNHHEQVPSPFMFSANKSFFQRLPLFQAATTWNRFVAATASRDLPSARDISNFFDQ